MLYNGEFKEKTILITGGSQGIGNGLARAFAAEGANIVITGRNVEKLEKAASKLSGDYGVKVLGVAADGGKEADVINTINETLERFGRLDCLINNASSSASGTSLIDHTTADFDKAIYSGIYATFFFMKYSYPHLKDSKGSVINFASGAGLFGKEGQTSYAAAKEGIRGLSRVAATEWGPVGIRVNVVCPLAMTPGLEAWKAEYPELYEKTIQGIPLGRFADPEQDIGNACLFLASSRASYITGDTINLQGGSGLRP